MSDVITELDQLSEYCEPARSNAIAEIIRLTAENGTLRQQLSDTQRALAELRARSESK